jgi:hypothetical protein
MRILKEYEVKINLTSAEQYSGMLFDPTYLANHIKSKFEGRCLDLTFITTIREIRTRSMVSQDKNDLSGGGSFYCVFLAEAIVYPADSVIVGCEVTTIERDGRIICKYDNAIIQLKGDKRFSPNKGDLIPVRVIRTGYPLGLATMNIAAQPYFIQPLIKMRLFKPDAITSTEQDLINRKLTEISDVKKAYDAADSKLVKFFEELFYPFQEQLKKPPFDVKDILQLVKKQDLPADPIIICRHPGLVKSDTQVFLIPIDVVKNLPQSEWTNKDKLEVKIIPATYGEVLLEILDDYCSFLETITHCCDVYNTEQIRKKHQKIWTIYNSIKI